MSQKYTYIDNYKTTFYVDLGQSIRLGTIQGWAESANLLEVATSAITHDDPNANLGHSGDAILGLKNYAVDESDETAGNQRVFMGFITDRQYARGDTERPSLRVGSERQIGISLVDCNALASFRLITGADGNRPAETVSARLHWLLGSTYFAPLGLFDNGFVDYPTSPTLDANDYRQQKPADVLNDCCLATAYNAWIYFDEVTHKYSLWFKDSNASTAYTSTLKLAGIISDCDFSTTYPAADATLRRTPDHTFAGASVPYAKGNVYVSRPATADTYGWRDGIAPNSNAKTAARASHDGTLFIAASATEEDRITCTVELPSAKVNHIRQGMRIQCKWPWLPGYESFTYMRVLRRTVQQQIPNQLKYTIQLELSPQEQPPAVSCPTVLSALTVFENGPYYQPDHSFSHNGTQPPAPSVVPSVIVGGFGGGASSGGNAWYDFTSAHTKTWRTGDLGSHFDSTGGYLVQTAAGLPPPMVVSQTGGVWGPTGYTWLTTAIPTAATSPAHTGEQIGSGVNLAMTGTPTVGNILVAWSLDSLNNSSTPRDLGLYGWSLIYMSAGSGVGFPCEGIATAAFGVWARCVQPGDTDSIPVGDAAFTHWTFAQEWALT